MFEERKKKDSTILAIRLTKLEKEKLKEISSELGINTTDLVKRAIKNYIERDERK